MIKNASDIRTGTAFPQHFGKRLNNSLGEYWHGSHFTYSL